MVKAQKLPSGKYRVRVYLGKEKGYKSFTADTKREAEFLAVEYEREYLFHQLPEMTLREAMRRYIDCKENILSPSTIVGYRKIYNTSLKEIMDIKLSDLTQEMIQRAFNEEAKTHSPKSLRNTHGLLASVMKMYRNIPHLSTTLPQKERNEIYVPDEEEVARLYKLVKQFRKGKLIKPFLLATQCGLRASEISALDVKSVKEDRIVVDKARVVGKIKAPKSTAGFREVPISSEMRKILLEKVDGDRICRMSSGNISNDWCIFRKKFGVDPNLNFHALRHHFASKCLLMGIPQKYIAELMGHNGTEMIERVYQHIFPSAMQRFAQQLQVNMSSFLENGDDE